MKLLSALCLAASLIWISACKDDKEDGVYQYHAHIRSPDSSVKQLNDTLHIEIDFESHTGEPIHNIRVGIFNEQTLIEVYIEPFNNNINDPDGEYRFEDDVVLSASHGFTTGTWTLTAEVWGPTDDEELEIEEVTFQIQ